jgi:hypothetical protein
LLFGTDLLRICNFWRKKKKESCEEISCYKSSVNLHQKKKKSATNLPRIFTIWRKKKESYEENSCYKISANLHKKEKICATNLPKIFDNEEKIRDHMKKILATKIHWICINRRNNLLQIF